MDDLVETVCSECNGNGTELRQVTVDRCETVICETCHGYGYKQFPATVEDGYEIGLNILGRSAS
jgi:DnaJ-class molecular chaperone